MQELSTEQLLAFDQKHIWHPYSSMSQPMPMQMVESAEGVYIHLANGKKLIDGMASWWSVIHGYNHPQLNRALIEQSQKVSHVMFGGLTHEPAIKLCQNLVEISPEGLDKVFLSDSGSVAVEVAMKMAIQYWHARQQGEKNQFLSLNNGYHGDTFGAMSVCDPVTGMHHLFAASMMRNHFSESPSCAFDQPFNPESLHDLEQQLDKLHGQLAALILEPIVQGAGGMKFYHPDYLTGAKALCQQYNVLLIADEIATGFGRTGEMFACQHANISPDILCLGKSLTGGYMSLAATLTTEHIASTISNGEANCFMHGPTFMANPLACAVANQSIELLKSQPWQSHVKRIECFLKQALSQLGALNSVADVRVLGAIGVIEMHEAVEMKSITEAFIDAGVWLRPFGKLIYIMPAFCMSDQELAQLTQAMVDVVNRL